MHESGIHAVRRQRLRALLAGGMAVLIGNSESPINYGHNAYPFHQDATFRYFFGIDRPALAAVIDVDSGQEVLFGDDPGEEELLWLGDAEPLAQQAMRAGCSEVRSAADLAGAVLQARRAGRAIHFLPPYRDDVRIRLAGLCGLPVEQVHAAASAALISAVVALRERKDAREIEEIEQALQITREMHLAAMAAARPGEYERAAVARMREVLGRHGVREAYAPIFTRNGQVLHHMRHDNRLACGDLVVNDAGAASLGGYASDITRSLPVGGRFTARQRDLYEILLQAQADAMQALRPRRPFAEVHRAAALRMAEGMRGLGFFRGASSDVVDSGAYAICFPHGVGHQLGLDIHDMESLGEDAVGYGGGVSRSAMFGLRNLRLAKPVCQDMVVTIEPGIYFIPRLIGQWAQQGRHRGLIDYAAFEQYLDFGGMRVEDDVLVTETGHRVLGPHIPRTLAEIEEAMPH